MLRQQRSHEIRSSWFRKNKYFFALYTNLKTRQMNSSNPVGKTEHKWRKPHILNPLLAKEFCSLCLHGRSDKFWPMNSWADWRKTLKCRRGINGRKFLSALRSDHVLPLSLYKRLAPNLPLENFSRQNVKKKELYAAFFCKVVQLSSFLRYGAPTGQTVTSAQPDTTAAKSPNLLIFLTMISTRLVLVHWTKIWEPRSVK